MLYWFQNRWYTQYNILAMSCASWSFNSTRPAPEHPEHWEHWGMRVRMDHIGQSSKLLEISRFASYTENALQKNRDIWKSMQEESKFDKSNPEGFKAKTRYGEWNEEISKNRPYVHTSVSEFFHTCGCIPTWVVCDPLTLQTAVLALGLSSLQAPCSPSTVALIR